MEKYIFQTKQALFFYPDIFLLLKAEIKTSTSAINISFTFNYLGFFSTSKIGGSLDPYAFDMKIRLTDEPYYFHG